MNATGYYSAGRLGDAVAAALAEVQRSPADAGRRAFLAELACFAGDLERADRQLDVLSTTDPRASVGVSLFRQLVRAEQARRQFFTEGRLPEFLGEPTHDLTLHLEAS